MMSITNIRMNTDESNNWSITQKIHSLGTSPNLNYVFVRKNKISNEEICIYDLDKYKTLDPKPIEEKSSNYKDQESFDPTFNVSCYD